MSITYALGPIEGQPHHTSALLSATGLWHRQNFADREARLVVAGDFIGQAGEDWDTVSRLMISSVHPAALIPANFKEVTILKGWSEVQLCESYIRWCSQGPDVPGASIPKMFEYENYGAPQDADGELHQHVEWMNRLSDEIEVGPFLIGSSASLNGRHYNLERYSDEWAEELSKIEHRLEIVVGDHADPRPVLCGRRLNISTGVGYSGGNLSIVVLDPQDEENPIVAVLRVPRATMCAELGEMLEVELTDWGFENVEPSAVRVPSDSDFSVNGSFPI